MHGQGRTGQDRAAQDRTGQVEAGQGRSRLARTGQGRSRQAQSEKTVAHKIYALEAASACPGHVCFLAGPFVNEALSGCLDANEAFRLQAFS